jgi:hypothetical protein
MVRKLRVTATKALIQQTARSIHKQVFAAPKAQREETKEIETTVTN